jgi:hypothetical protein
VVDNIRQTIALYKAGERVEMPEELCAELRKALRTKWQQKYPAGNT